MKDARRQAYSGAFIAQARSDFQVYRHLAQSPEFAVCHALHYLQMATEKLARAYRLRDSQSPVAGPRSILDAALKDLGDAPIAIEHP